MDSTWASSSHQDLMTELDRVERAIARSSTFQRYTDQCGQTRVRVTPELLALADREHLIVAELRRRHQGPLAA